MIKKKFFKPLIAAILTLSLTIGCSVMVFATGVTITEVGPTAWTMTGTQDKLLSFSMGTVGGYDISSFDYTGKLPDGLDMYLTNGEIWTDGTPLKAENTEVDVTYFVDGYYITYHENFRIKPNEEDPGIGDGKMLINWDALTGFYSTKEGVPVPNMQIVKQGSGAPSQAAFAAAKPYGWKTGFIFNMCLNNKTDYSLKDGTFSLILPTDYIKPGRTFAIMALNKDGTVKMYNDTDNADHSVTVPLDVEGYAFQLLYFN